MAAGLAVLLAACSGHSSAPPVAAGTPGGFNAALCPTGTTCPTGSAPGSAAAPPSPGDSATSSDGSFAPKAAVGVVHTDPAYVPVVQQPISAQNPATPAGTPAAGMLPEGWNPTSWISDVVAFTGQSTPTEPSPNLNFSQTWTKTTLQVSKGLSVFMARTSTGRPTMIQCSATGFDPKDVVADAQVLTDMTLCATADFPGSDGAAAAPWVTKQVGYILKDLTTMTTGQHLECATPSFGTGVYLMAAQVLDGQGPIVTLNVYGPGLPTP